MLRPVSGTVHPRLWLLPSLPSANFPSQAGEKRKEEMIAEEGGKVIILVAQGLYCGEFGDVLPSQTSVWL
jgi:hypothetical protein